MFKKYTVISGWYGPNNFGDEAILEAIIQKLKSESDSNNEIVVLGVKPSKTSELFPDVISCYQFPNDFKQLVKSVITLDLLKTLYVLMRAKKLYVGGGGFLSDWQSRNIGWLGQILFSKICGARCNLWGVGIGPFNNPIRTKFASLIFRSCIDFAYVRDQVSLDTLKNKLMFSGETRLDADPVAYMDCSKYKSTNLVKNQIIFVPAMYFKNKKFGKDTTKWDDLFDCYIKTLNYLDSLSIDVVVVFFQPDSEQALIAKFAIAIENLEHVVIKAHPDHRSALTDISESKGVFSFRLHGNIMAYASKIDFLPIIYHFKAEEFLKMVGLQDIPKIIVGDGVHIRQTNINWSEWKPEIDKFLLKIKL
jgi:polysaccharide pyruvyl transferase WcaK-like protein